MTVNRSNRAGVPVGARGARHFGQDQEIGAGVTVSPLRAVTSSPSADS
jgi:hypothetical protein